MTLSYERKWAVENTEKFLLDLCDPKKSPRVPKYVREEARRCLKHYPSKYDMDLAEVQAPDVFGKFIT